MEPPHCDECGSILEFEFIPEPDDLSKAMDEIRYGNLDEALIYLVRAIPEFDGLPALVAKEIARRTAPQGSAAP